MKKELSKLEKSGSRFRVIDCAAQNQILRNFIADNLNIPPDTKIKIRRSNVYKDIDLTGTCTMDAFLTDAWGNGRIWLNIKGFERGYPCSCACAGLYSSIKIFKAAIRELAAAIERGDSEFIFPADDETSNV